MEWTILESIKEHETVYFGDVLCRTKYNYLFTVNVYSRKEEESKKSINIW